MKRHSQIQFGSLLVSPWSATPYSDAINRGGKTSEGTASGRKTRIKRPMNGFMVWSQTKRRELSADNPGLHNSEISRRLGQLWLQLTEEDRLPFMEEAERLRTLHSRQYPGYIYRPRKKKALAEATLEAADEMRREVKSLPPADPGQWMEESRQTKILHERGSRSAPSKCTEKPSRKQDFKKGVKRSFSCQVETLHRHPWEVQSQLDESCKYSDKHFQTLDWNDINKSGPSYQIPETQGFQDDWDQVLSPGGQPSFQTSYPPRNATLGSLPSPVEANPWPHTLWHDHITTLKGVSGVYRRSIPPELTNKNWSSEEGGGIADLDLDPAGSNEYRESSDFTAGGGSSAYACPMQAIAVSPTSEPCHARERQPQLNISNTAAHRWTIPASKAPDSLSVSSSTGSYQDCWDSRAGSYNDYCGNAAGVSPDFKLSPITFDIDPINLPDDLSPNDLSSSAAASSNYATTPDPFVSWLINFYDVEPTNPRSADQ